MAGLVSKLVAKKFFGETVANKGGQEDPYFERIPTRKLGIKTTKKVKRALPPGLTQKEEKILIKAKRRAYRIDLSLGTCCGLRFGWGAVIGFVPVIGDALDFMLAYMVYKTCCSIEPPLPQVKRSKMVLNMMFDFGIGLIPFIGDIIDAAYKCNTRNVILLEDELRSRGLQRLREQGRNGTHDPSMADDQEGHDIGAPPPSYAGQRGEPDLERGDRVR